MTQQLPPSTVENQANPQQQVILVRNTASGFEQGVAAIAGLLTAGPLGALASWGTIRGLQGKWLPWFVIGVPAAPVLGLLQLGMGIGGLGILGTMMNSTPSTPSTPPAEERLMPSEPEAPAPSYTPNSSLTNTSWETCFSSVFPGSDGRETKEFGCKVTNPEPGFVNVTWSDGVESTFVNYDGDGFDSVRNVKTGHLDYGTIKYVTHEGNKYMHFESDKGGESWIPVTNMNY